MLGHKIFVLEHKLFLLEQKDKLSTSLVHHTYVAPDLGSSLYAIVQNTDKSVSRLKWVNSELIQTYKGL